MNRKHILGLSLLAVLAVSAITVASAFADATHVFLVSGVAITELLSVETTGELELSDLSALLGQAATVSCSGILDGTISPEGKDEITELLTLTGVAISSTPLTGVGLVCTNILNCPEPDVWALNLPWKTELTLSGTSYIDTLTTTNGDKLVGYEIECLGAGNLTDDCEKAALFTTMENMVEAGKPDLLAIFAEENSATCELSKSATADILGTLLIEDLEKLGIEVSEK